MSSEGEEGRERGNGKGSAPKPCDGLTVRDYGYDLCTYSDVLVAAMYQLLDCYREVAAARVEKLRKELSATEPGADLSFLSSLFLELDRYLNEAENKLNTARDLLEHLCNR